MTMRESLAVLGVVYLLLSACLATEPSTGRTEELSATGQRADQEAHDSLEGTVETSSTSNFSEDQYNEDLAPATTPHDRGDWKQADLTERSQCSVEDYVSGLCQERLATSSVDGYGQSAEANEADVASQPTTGEFKADGAQVEDLELDSSIIPEEKLVTSDERHSEGLEGEGTEEQGVNAEAKTAEPTEASNAEVKEFTSEKDKLLVERLRDIIPTSYVNVTRTAYESWLNDLKELKEIVNSITSASVQMRQLVKKPNPPADKKKDESLEDDEYDALDELDIPTTPSTAVVKAASSALFTVAALQAVGVFPDELPRDTASTLVLLHKAAEGGSIEAHLALTDRFFMGRGVEENCDLGLKYAKLAAELVSVDLEKTASRFSAPLLPLKLRDKWMDPNYIAPIDNENAAHVLQYEEDLAMRGNVEAQRRMAYRRLMGRGVEADPEGAYHDFLAGAQQGDSFALFNLGYMYLRGMFVSQNYTAARDYFEQAAEKGLASGYNGVGVMDWNGQGAPANLTAARLAFEKGAKLNNSDCFYNLGILYLHGLGVDANTSLAVEHFMEANVHGHWRAPFMLGSLFSGEMGVERNCSKATPFYRKFFADRATWNDELQNATKALKAGEMHAALLQYLVVAEQGSELAATNAAFMFKHGLGYSGSDRMLQAFSMFRRSALLGSTSSMVEMWHILSWPHEYGLHHLQPDPEEALMWLRRAEAKDSVEGLFYLGWATQLGLGCARNLTEAATYYKRAMAIAAKAKSFAAYLAPMCGITALRLQALLQLLVGPGPVLGMWAALGHFQQSLGRPWHLDKAAPAASSAMAVNWQHLQGVVTSGVRRLVQSVPESWPVSFSWEDMVMAAMVVALVLVLYWRRSQQGMRTAAPPQPA